MWKDSETEIDYLDYGYMVNILTDIICNDALLPASIGIYGDWGSGKSSLMHMCIKKLETDKKAKCLIFNGWLFESYSDAKTALLNSILDSIAENKTLSQNAKDILKGLYKSVDKLQLAQKAIKYGAGLMLPGGIGVFTGITGDIIGAIVKKKLPELTEKIDGSKIKENMDQKSLRDDIREFQAQFAKLIEESKIERLVIFIDELDRCREDTILDTLEAMKLFMFTGKVAFVIGADERHISYAVKSKFKDIEGIQIDIGKEYLEKLVQYPVHIPRMDIDETEVYIASLLLSAEVKPSTFEAFQRTAEQIRENDFEASPLKAADSITIDEADEKVKFTECLSIAKQLSAVLSQGLHGNPRQVKRFLNALDMRMSMAQYKHVILDRKVLAKLMMLEYIRPQAFRRFAELAENDSVKVELSKLENETGDTDVEKLALKTWIKDEWLTNWLSIEPPLAETKLNPYLYFARTSLDEKISRISRNLSPDAQNALNLLSTKADANIAKALQIEVSEVDAMLVLEALAEQLRKESKIDKTNIKPFLEFAQNDPSRYVSSFEHIKTFSPSALQIPTMVFLAEYTKKTGLQSEMEELVAEWGKTNQALHNTFENCMK